MADAHSHSHSHGAADERTAYYLDQLFAIGAAGSLAAVTIVLWQGQLLGKMLHPNFHFWVGLGGLVLMAIVAVRAITVWMAADQAAAAPCAEGHAHGEECGHAHGSEAAPHSHSHAHSHSHGGDDGHDHGWAPWRYVVLLLPVVLYFLVLSNPDFDREPVASPSNPLDHIINFIIIFKSIVWEALPFIVLGALIAGFVDVYLPQRWVTAVLPRSAAMAVAAGGLLGLVFPMCECGIVPVMRRLLRKGLPLSCCIAYLLAGPIINVVVLLSTWAAFQNMENAYVGGKPSYQMGGWWMMGFRAGLGYLTAVVTALIVEWQFQKHGNALLMPLARKTVEEGDGEKLTPTEQAGKVSEVALHDFVDITVFLILGAALAASVRLFLGPEQIAEMAGGELTWYGPLVAILLMMGLAIALCLCSEADAFVAASMVALRPSAKLAFLVLGPMLDFKLYAMYTRIFRPRLILTIYTAVIVQVFVYCVAVHYWWEANKEWLVSPQPVKSAITEKEILASAGRAEVGLALVGIPTPGGFHLPLTLSAAGMMSIDPDEQAMEITPLQLEAAANSADMRAFYENKLVWLTGRFVGNERQFRLLRYKINCCAADATPVQAILRMDARSKETIDAAMLKDRWVKVVGRIRFLTNSQGQYIPAIIILPSPTEPLNKLIEVIPQPANPMLN
jgi:uncharacterized membrane protein YraQ (UPF0718 family)